MLIGLIVSYYITLLALIVYFISRVNVNSLIVNNF